MISLLKRNRYWLRSIPLVGPVCDTTLSDHKEAFIEVLISVVLSTTPIWLGSLLLLAYKGKSATFLEYLNQNVRDGEILLLCSALISPLVYFVFVQRKGMPSFPAARSLMLVVLFILLVSCALFAFQRADSLLGTGVGVDNDLIFSWSLIAFGCAVFVSYLATSYRNFREGEAVTKQMQETEGVVAGFNERQGAQDQ